MTWTTEPSGQQHYEPTFDHQVDLAIAAIRERAKRCVKMASRPNCPPKRREKLLRRAKQLMNRLGVEQA